MGYFKNLSTEIRQSRRSVGLPFEISLESISETEKFQRAQDKESLKKFNADVQEWTDKSVLALKSSIGSMVKNDILLSDSLKGKLYYDRKYGSEVNRVGFSFAREGIYIHKGAGKGQGGNIGGRWIDKYGTQRERAPKSAGLQGTGNRKPKRWFDPVINNRLAQLADIVADYSATMQIDATNIFIEK